MCKRGSLPRRTHHGSSLGAVKLDDEEQREQQRTQRQLKASNVSQEKNVSAIAPVRGASLQVVRTKVIDSKCNYEREKCKTTTK